MKGRQTQPLRRMQTGKGVRLSLRAATRQKLLASPLRSMTTPMANRAAAFARPAAPT